MSPHPGGPATTLPRREVTAVVTHTVPRVGVVVAKKPSCVQGGLKRRKSTAGPGWPAVASSATSIRRPRARSKGCGTAPSTSTGRKSIDAVGHFACRVSDHAAADYDPLPLLAYRGDRLAFALHSIRAKSFHPPRSFLAGRVPRKRRKVLST
jgi:hypothetical protein